MAKKEYLSDTVWYGDLKGTTAFDVGELKLPFSEIEIEGQKLFAKTEFHISLIAARKYAERTTSDAVEARRLESEIVDVARRYVSEHPLEFAGLTGDYYLCEDGDEMTIIGLVNIKGVEELLREVTGSTGVTIDPPKLHVTLYKNEKSPYGIGIRNEEDFAKLCRELPEAVSATFRDNAPALKA